MELALTAVLFSLLAKAFHGSPPVLPFNLSSTNVRAINLDSGRKNIGVEERGIAGEKAWV